MQGDISVLLPPPSSGKNFVEQVQKMWRTGKRLYGNASDLVTMIKTLSGVSLGSDLQPRGVWKTDSKTTATATQQRNVVASTLRTTAISEAAYAVTRLPAPTTSAVMQNATVGQSTTPAQSTGWVEATPVRYDARSVSIGIAGRSQTADLIDCAAEPTQFNGRSLVQIAQALAAPFGIEVVNSGAPSGVIPDVQPDHGETVIEVINKILGQQQALAYDDPHGRLVIGGIGSTRAHTALVLGENILSCDTEKSIRERFSVYQVAGQRAGNDDDFGEATTTALR
ncbi:hypothetical protein ACUC97_29325, partial [Escherichia coli]